MATPFSDIFGLFLSNIADDSLIDLDDIAREDNMKAWLVNGLAGYHNPKSDLTFDLEKDEFVSDLDSTEKVILSKLMTIEYINPYLLDETLLKQKLSLKDYSVYSPANHLKELRQLKESLSLEVSRLIVGQSYSVSNINKWFGNSQ